jgi:hypothetical protein
MSQSEIINIPFQVESLIKQMQDKSESAYIRGNFRNRLVEIQVEVQKAITAFDNEMAKVNAGRLKRR